jgi:DNA/RNA-binding domain of Phe-tRNA-synthetase-like protein
MDNSGEIPAIDLLLKRSISEARSRFEGVNVKEYPAIACYREAFRRLGYNPNKFPCSVEALTSRITKGGEPPSINPVVNLVNAVSLKHTLPMGAHDMDSVSGGIAVRYAREGESFTPLGETEPEAVPVGELVYADDREVRTRRWIWRQNDRGKVTHASRNVFFPVDGFTDVNKAAVERAMEELSGLLETFFRVRPATHFLDQANNSAEV